MSEETAKKILEALEGIIGQELPLSYLFFVRGVEATQGAEMYYRYT